MQREASTHNVSDLPCKSRFIRYFSIIFVT